jgi:tetratricopeptide (TPR) repeat protein
MQGGDDLSDPNDLNVAQPMQYMADGGFVVPPQMPVVYRPQDREYLEARQAEAEAYDAQRNAYNTALEKYRAEVYNPYEAQLNEYNTAAQAYNRDVYEPYQAAYKRYEEAVNAFNAGPLTEEYAGPSEPTLTPFSRQAPTAPQAFSMQAPTLPFKEEEVAARQEQAAELARQDAASRGLALEAINAPGQYNLSAMSRGSGIAGLSVPGYMRGGPVIAKPPQVLTSKQMLRKLGNKTRKFEEGGAVRADRGDARGMLEGVPEYARGGFAGRIVDAIRKRSRPPELPAQAPAQAQAPSATQAQALQPTMGLNEQIASLQKRLEGMPPQIMERRNTFLRRGTRTFDNPEYLSAQSQLQALLKQRDASPAVAAPVTPTVPAPAGSAKSDLTEIPKPPSGSVVAPTRNPDGNVYGPYTSSDGKWFFNQGKWVENQTITLDPRESPGGYQPPITLPPGQPTQPPQQGGRGSPESQDLAKRVLEMAVKRTKPDMMWDTNGDGRISAADALQVAKGWRPKDYTEPPTQPAPVIPAPVTPAPVIPSPQVPRPVTPAPIVPTPGLPPGGQPPITRPMVPVPSPPTTPRTPPLFSPPPPGVMPGTIPMPFNPFQASQGPTALDLLQQNPNLSPTVLGGQSNLGFMQDRLGNVIRAPGTPPIRTFAVGGEVDEDAYEPLTVGTASQMLQEMPSETQTAYEASPKKVSVKRVSRTPMESASGSARGMKMELEEISAMKGPKAEKALKGLSRADLEEMAREYGLKRTAALNTAKGLMRATFDKPSLEKPSLTKGSLTKRRFEEGGEVKKDDGAEEKSSAPAYDDPFRSGRPLPRKGRVKGTQESNEALSRAVAQGVANMPYNLAGAPVDFINMALTPVGLGSRTPVMGSEWVKQKMTDLGVRPEPPTDPTAAALYGAADIGSSLMSPVGVTREGARVGSAAARATGKALSEAAEDFRQYNRMLDVPGASYAVKPGASREPIYQPLPSAEAPFVGRVDQFIAALPGPVRKDQLLGQLSNKFREYEVGRAREALKDLDDTAKLAPADILNRLRTQYNPSYYRTQTVDPAPTSFYPTMDNPFGPQQPLGVFHLVEDMPPEVAQKRQIFSDKYDEVTRRTYGTIPRNEAELQQGWADTQFLLQDAPEAARARAKEVFDQYAEANRSKGLVSDLMDSALYPSLHPNFPDYYAAAERTLLGQGMVPDSARIMEGARSLAKQNVAREALTTLKDQHGFKGLEPFFDNLSALTGRRNPVMDELDQVLQTNRQPYTEQIKNSGESLRNFISQNIPQSAKPYYGQHRSLRGDQEVLDPIAFSRFSEHVTDIPGVGRVPGVYVHELQSDRLDDLRKLGALGGSPQKDLEAKVRPLMAQQQQLLEDIARYRAEGNSPEAKAQLGKLQEVERKFKKLTSRMAEGTYDIREAFSGMEEAPQVIQQLMAKNAISAAMQRQARFVAFPGKESAQAQLYENLPNNLKQVVKDLGPGFEYRSVTLTNKDGEEFMAPAVVWGDEAVARIRKQGVPFAKGGPVNKHDAFIKAHA